VKSYNTYKPFSYSYCETALHCVNISIFRHHVHKENKPNVFILTITLKVVKKHKIWYVALAVNA